MAEDQRLDQTKDRRKMGKKTRADRVKWVVEDFRHDFEPFFPGWHYSVH